MNRKLMLILVLAACAAGTSHHVASRPSVLETLLETPRHSSGDGGIKQIWPGHVLEESCQADRITIIVFYYNNSARCQSLLRHLSYFAGHRGDAALRMVDLGEYWLGLDYKSKYGTDIKMLPHVMIFGRDGKLLIGDDGHDKAGLDMLYRWMNEEIKRDSQ